MELELYSWSRSRPFFHGVAKKGGFGRLRLHNTAPVSCIFYRVSPIMSRVSRLLSYVSYLTFPVFPFLSCLTSPVSRLLSHVSRAVKKFNHFK